LRRGFLRSDGFVLLALVAVALVVGWASSEHTAWSPPAMLALVVLMAKKVMELSPEGSEAHLVVSGDLWLNELARRRDFKKL